MSLNVAVIRDVTYGKTPTPKDVFPVLLRSVSSAKKLPKVLLRAVLCIVVCATTLVALEAGPSPVATASTSSSASFWITNPLGQVWNFGSAADYGDLSGTTLNKPIVGIAPTPDNKGYWLVATDGGIFAFGDAKFYGSTGAIKLNKPIVGMAPTPTNKGYWLVASDGGIFAYGDAAFYGSTGSLKLNKPIVAMAATPTNKGYWLIASDGGIFAYGDAKFFGSTGAITLNQPIVAMAPTPTNKGYWLVASDGGIFAYGDAKFFGSTGGGSDQSYSRVITTSDGAGYWLVRNGGDAVAYGDALGSSAAAATPAAGAAPSNAGPTVQVRPTIGLVYNITGPRDLTIMFAMSQQGLPYVWGATGPGGYDCSGLVQTAWAHGGVTLPRVAADQYNYGTHVALTDLRPGDIVFWGSNTSSPSTIYHDALYIGGGNVVMAPKTGDVVRTSAIWTQDLMPLAVRPR